MKNELVIAWCREDIDWVQKAVAHFDQIIIYSKCNTPPSPVVLSLLSSEASEESHFHYFFSLFRSSSQHSATVLMESLANVGACDHTYLHHITAHWDSLAEWTVFYKGFQEDSCPASTLLPVTSSIQRNGFFCCPGHHSPRATKLQMSKGFKLRNYEQQHHKGSLEVFHQYDGTMGQWVTSLFGEEIADRLFDNGPHFCFGGYFSVNRTVLLSHSFLVYKTLMWQMSHPLEEIDHYVERLWSPLFRSDPIECNSTGRGVKREYDELEMEKEWRVKFKKLRRNDVVLWRNVGQKPPPRKRLSLAFKVFIALLCFLWLAFVVSLFYIVCAASE